MNSPDSELHWQDEILQVMYWMWGENLGQDVTPEQLNRLLHLEPRQVETALQQLLALGLIQAHASTHDSPTSF
jgi:transcriptional regulator GlxA family with amidase domain